MTVSIVIPAFNRPEPLKFTLRSADEAIDALGRPAEIVLVDDGSTPCLEAQLAGFSTRTPVTFRYQSNRGSIAARLSGLSAARGTFVLFLDSDDLIHPAKLVRHLEALETDKADISYDDMANAALVSGYGAVFSPGAVVARADETADWALRVQPAPHNPIYRRDFLEGALKTPTVPADRSMDAVGDVWMYYNLCIQTGRIAKLDAFLTAIGPHTEERFSSHWERLGIAALRVAESFIERCPATPRTMTARSIAGECAFNSWRRLPRDFSPEFSARILSVWRRAPRGPLNRLGGPLFQSLARCVGPEMAGRILRRRNGTYSACRTVTAEELNTLLQS